MKIAVIGTGYVGLVSGTCFAETGNTVTCVDIDENKVNQMKNSEIPIYEPGLEVLFKRNIKQGRLTFTTDLAHAVEHAQIIFYALPTPSKEDGSADLSYILNVAEQTAKIISDYKVIVNKSTVPVGTAEKVKEVFLKNTNIEVDVVSNPEFLREGVAVEDFMKPDRVVVGTSSERARQIMADLYMPYVRQGNPIYFMDERSSELTKYAANAFLATKITFMNEIANLCEKVGADVDLIRKGIGSDHRIGNKFLYAGIGYGGSCFPKDVKALKSTSDDFNYNFKILDAVVEVNEYQKSKLALQVDEYYNGNLKDKLIAVWGLAFKPETDDIREAPSLYIIDHLLSKGARIKVFDPESMTNVKSIYGDKLIYTNNQYEAVEGADALIIATEWSVFRTPSFEDIESKMKSKVIFDGRNLYGLEQMNKLGFEYFSIGRR